MSGDLLFMCFQVVGPAYFSRVAVDHQAGHGAAFESHDSAAVGPFRLPGHEIVAAVATVDAVVFVHSEFHFPNCIWPLIKND